MITILVVEDETYARQSLVKQIHEYDRKGQFQVLEADNGKKGYELFLQKEPELIMTDIRMPVMDGLELIKAVREKSRSTAVVMLSAYSDFDYARTALTCGAIDYLLKPIQDELLRDCLDQFLNKNRTAKRETMMTGQDVISRYILCCMREQHEEDFIGEKTFLKMFPIYQLLAIHSYGNRHFDQGTILTRLETMFDREIWTGFRLVQAESRLWIMVIQADHDAAFIPRKVLRALEEEQYEACIGISRIYTEPKQLGHAYRDSVDALEHKLFTDKKIIMWEELTGIHKSQYVLPQKKEAFLYEALEDKNGRRVRQLLEEVFTELQEEGEVDVESLRILFSKLMLLLRGALKGSDEMSLRESSATIRDYRNLEEMKTYFIRVGENICQLAGGREPGQSRDVVHVMMEYARDHFDEEITVKELAEKVLFMNSAYLSHVFAEKMGISFSAWLRRLRVEHAKKLLEEGTVSVTEAAGLSGYNDTSQFIRVFKGEIGMTPKQYKSASERSPADQ